MIVFLKYEIPDGPYCNGEDGEPCELYHDATWCRHRDCPNDECNIGLDDEGRPLRAPFCLAETRKVNETRAYQERVLRHEVEMSKREAEHGRDYQKDPLTTLEKLEVGVTPQEGHAKPSGVFLFPGDARRLGDLAAMAEKAIDAPWISAWDGYLEFRDAFESVRSGTARP